MDAFHPDHLPPPATLPSQPPMPQPGISLLRRLPDSLAGPVRLRRRRHIFHEWAYATARLKGSALIIFSRASTPTVLSAVDVHQVFHTAARGYTAITVRSCTGVEVRLRVYIKPSEWVSTLTSLASAAAPRLNDFSVVAPIGKGGGGEVYMARQKGYASPLAMKVVQKHDAFYSDGSLRHALDERLVLELVRGFPFVIRLTHAFQTEKALYMVSEFCSGGNLRTLLKKQKGGRLHESVARGIMAQVVLALEHLHSLNVIYRDIKPDNVLLTADGDVRICDFGLSKVLATGRYGRTRSFCGSTSYMSPQIVSHKPYGIATDLWSLGALFFRMLVGRGPFDAPADRAGANNEAREIEKRIQLEDVVIPGYLSAEAREMLEGLLRKNEERRTNLEDLKESVFFKDVDWDVMLDQGFRKAAKQEDMLMGDGLGNFDADRLRSHGVELRDEEMRLRGLKRPDLERGGFLKRKASQFGLVRTRSELTRKPSGTSIVGFGFSYASDTSLKESDGSLHHSDSDTTTTVS